LRPLVKTNCIKKMPTTPKEVRRQLKTAKVKAGLLRPSDALKVVHPSSGSSYAFKPTPNSVVNSSSFKKVQAAVAATEKIQERRMSPKRAHLI
jgi:hypothetical protein